MITNRRFIPVKPLVLLLCGTIFIGSLTACGSSYNETNDSSYHSTQTTNNISKPSSMPESIKVKQLSEINATFSHTRWVGEEYIKIDEESLLEIIQLAMSDAKDMYLSLGATNMTIDSSGKNSTNSNDFYPEWMNEYFFLARAKRESGNYMIDYVGPAVDEAGNRANGIMCLVPEYIVPTLDEYFKNTFKSNISFQDKNLIPNYKDLATFENSKQARENLKQAVYDNVFTSICYDIYNTKCLGPNHTDYYSKFDGFNEELRQQTVIALYLYKRNDVISSLKNGTFYQKFGSTSYVQDILNFQDRFQKQYENQSSMDK